MNRALYSIVLLVLIASNALIGVHAASHVTVDPTECELCAAYNDPSDAIPADRVEIPPLQRQSHDSLCGAGVDAQTTPLTVRQRAPPASS